VDVLSFKPPAGWETTQKANSGPVTMRDVNQAKDISCQITVYNSLQSSGDLAADFFSEWTAVIGSPVPEKGFVSDEGTRIVGEASAVPVSGQNNYVRLITYSAGAKMASIVIVTPNVEAYEAHRPQIDSFLASVTVNSIASGTPSVVAEEQAQQRPQDQAQASRTNVNPTPQPERGEAPALQLSQEDADVAEGILFARQFGAVKKRHLAARLTPSGSNKLVWVAEWNKSVRTSDLSGKWICIDHTTGYGDKTFFQDTFFFKGDGTFTCEATMRGANTSDEKYKGTYVLSPRPVLKYNSVTYNILHFSELPDGSATMTILGSQYPIEEVSRREEGYLYLEEKLIRAAPEATPRLN
jgi:hypothetical protein